MTAHAEANDPVSHERRAAPAGQSPERSSSPASAETRIDAAGMDTEVRPQDDLFRHANGSWLRRQEIPAHLPRYGSFTMLGERAEQHVREILEGGLDAPEGSEERKAADAYAAYMDEDRLRELGVEPIAEDLAEASAVESIDAFLRLLGRLERTGLGGFLQSFVYPDADAPDRYALYLEQGGLGLPDESFYRDEQYAAIREAYVPHIARMLEMAGIDDPQHRAEQVMRLETAIASHHWDVVASRDELALYNPRSWEELRAIFAEVDLPGWLRELDAPAGSYDRVILRQPGFAEGLAALLIPERLDEWRNWLLWHIVSQSAGLLTPEMGAANFEFYGTVLQGTPQQRERWKRGVGCAQGIVPDAIGRVYVARHFSPGAKERMLELVERLMGAYRDSISSLEWMTPATRQRALEKLDLFVTKIGYPERWRDYGELTVRADDLVGNARRSAVFESAYEYGKLGGPVRRDEWLMSPQTVNAYYSPGENEIVFPAAILQPPFFDEERDDAENYGAIGAIIGHEIGHGFDDQGSKRDGRGRLDNWWTDEDRAAFQQRTGALIGQYELLQPEGLDGAHVNGELTLGENIGDLGGLGIAWKAYLASLDGSPPPEISGQSAARRFFLAWAQAWRSKGRDEFTRMMLQIDPHSPAEFRCNQIVRNLDAFHEAFGVAEGDAMWLDPAERVTIW